MRGIFELDEVVNAPKRENLMIVDALNLAFRFKHRGQTDFAAEYLRTVDSLAKSYGAKEVIITTDHKFSKYRKKISPEYKEGRKERYKDQTPEQEQQAKEFFADFEKTMELIVNRYHLVKYEYVEADDLAAFLVKKLTNSFEHIWLISSDMDWDLLLSNKVSRFSFVTRKEYTLDNFYEMHSCDTPEQLISVKVLMGDSGDSVQGIEGIGVKRAYNLVREYGSAFNVYDKIPLEGNQKFIKRINDSKDLIPINYQLMDLLSFCEDAISFPDEKNLNKIEEFCSAYY